MSNVRQWLTGLGFGQFAGTFEQHQIDLDVAFDLTDQDLKDLGVTALGERKRMLSAIAEYRNSTATNTPPTASAPATQKGERRQLTVLFCDMVGFTQLASRVDPEVLSQIIRIYEDACAVCITRYEGYVFQRLGDGIVAFFGYPLAHEGEAERAVHAGLAIIQSLSSLVVPEANRLQVRIGIASGLVVVSSLEKGAVGETMNLASRLQGIAPVGGLIVNESVRQLAGGRFVYESVGEQTLKGIDRAVPAYRVLGISTASSRFEVATHAGLTPMVGRETEIRMLLERWQQAQDGEGQAALLCGEPGIGKSRILSALMERLDASIAGAGSRRAISLHFQCLPYHSNSAFYPCIDNFERTLKFARDDAPDAKLEKLEALVVTQYGRPRDDVRFLGAMLSLPVERRFGPIQMTPQRFKDETLRALVDLIEAGARRQPSAVLFEDAHWADPTSLEVLDLLIDRVKDFPLLILITHRPEFSNRWGSHGHVSALNLSKLSKAQSSAMVERVTKGKALPGNLKELILTKTDGVPLYVEELTKAILESKDIEEKEDRYDYRGDPSRLIIPATLRDSLMARLDRYQSMKEVAQLGAVIGREFSYELIQAIAAKTEHELDRALQQLTDAGLVFRRGTPPEATYSFKHALVQDAAYDSLLKSRRQELHGTVAVAIERLSPATTTTRPEVLAHHYTQAHRLDVAIPLWQKAGELALKNMTLGEAISHLNRGLEIITTLPPSEKRDRLELGMRIPLGTAWMALKGWAAPEVWRTLHPALSLARNTERSDWLLSIYWGICMNVLVSGRVAESVQWTDEMLAQSQNRNDSDFRMIAHMTAVVCYFWFGDLTTARKHADFIQENYDSAKHGHLVYLTNHDPKTIVGIYASHWVWMLGYPDTAVTISEDKNEHARRIGHPFDLAFALTAGSQPYMYLQNFDEYRLRNEEAQRLGREHRMPFMSEIFAPMNLAGVSLWACPSREEVDRLRQALDKYAAVGAKVAQAFYFTDSAVGLARLGQLDEALSTISSVLEQICRPDSGEKVHYAEALRVKGWILSLKGDTNGAEKTYLESLDWAIQQQAKSWELRTATSLARLWQSQGKRQQAYVLLAPVYNWFSEGFDTKDLKEAKALLDQLTESLPNS